MTTKTKKILALIGWLVFIIVWNMLPAYHIVEYNYVLSRVMDVLIVCIGTYILLWVFNPGMLKNKDKE
jgi:exosortase/archaeosortase